MFSDNFNFHANQDSELRLILNGSLCNLNMEPNGARIN
jgi:hypothetical protein